MIKFEFPIYEDQQCFEYFDDFYDGNSIRWILMKLDYIRALNVMRNSIINWGGLPISVDINIKMVKL